MEEGDSLNNQSMFTMEKGGNALDLEGFFQTLIYILMVTAFIAIVIIFLLLLRGQEEKTE